VATVRAQRSDLFPPGTTVSVRPHGSKRDGGVPAGAELASGTVDSTGLLEITDSDIVSYARFVLYASVGGEHRYCNVRSTLDIHDAGTFTATGDTTSGSTSVANASASAGSIQAGMRVTGSGIPAGTRIHSVSGATLTLTAAATATATGVTLLGDGAYAWRAKVRRRRAALGTA
jgi:hypothetical protein